MKTIVRRIIMAALLIAILIRPTIPGSSAERESTNLNIWFVVDASGSMVAKDVDGKNTRRFEKAQEDATTIIENLPGAKYTAIAQDFSTYTAVPMTSSADAIIAGLPYFRPKYTLYTKPSNISELLSYTADKVLQYKRRFPERSNAIVFMSDGEDISGKELEVPKTLYGLAEYVVVFGYGSTAGAPMEEIGGYNEKGEYSYSAISDTFIKSFNSTDSNITLDSDHRVLSKINEENLRKIASYTAGEYYHRESGAVADTVINQIKNSGSISHDSSSASVGTRFELYWIFALALLILLAWEGEELLTKLLAERNK